MTNKEAIEELKKVDTLDMPARLCEAHYMAIKALEQEPCNTDTCKVVKAYMNEWDKSNNSDVISRQSTLKPYEGLKDDDVIAVWLIRKNIEQQPSVNQEPKTGHWRRISIDKYSEHAKYWYRCDRCGKDNLGNTDWCPNCGCRMVEPQESEDRE